jgi:hypothetical protein
VRKGDLVVKSSPSKRWRVFDNISAASADALELGRQQLVAFIRRSLDVSIVAMAAIP